MKNNIAMELNAKMTKLNEEVAKLRYELKSLKAEIPLELNTKIIELKQEVNELKLKDKQVNSLEDNSTEDTEPIRVYKCAELIDELIDRMGDYGLEASGEIYDYETEKGFSIPEIEFINDYFEQSDLYTSYLFDSYADGKLIKTIIKITRKNK